MIRWKIRNFFYRLNNTVCTLFFNQCGYCSGRVHRLNNGVTVFQECKRMS